MLVSRLFQLEVLQAAAVLMVEVVMGVVPDAADPNLKSNNGHPDMKTNAKVTRTSPTSTMTWRRSASGSRGAELNRDSKSSN